MLALHRAMLFSAAAAVLLAGCKGRSKKGSVPFRADAMVATGTANPTFVHPNYRFRIAGLDNHWKILPPGEIEKIIPDASAGAIRVGGAYGAVIVEPVGDAQPADFLELVLSNMESVLPEVSIEDPVETTHKGRPAMTAGIRAVASGLEFRYEILAFVHEGHGYQLLAWHAVNSAATAPPLEEFFDAVDIVEGAIVPPGVQGVADFVGVGRRVVDGRFESPIYRIAAEAPEGWAIMDEAELKTANDSAELGMKHPVSGSYLVVIPERIDESMHDAYLENFVADTEDSLAAIGPLTGRDPVPITIGDENIPFECRTIEAKLPIRMYFAACARGPIVYQLQAWHVEQGGRDQSHTIADGFRGLSFLTDSEASAIKAELAALPDPQAAVGPGYSLRNGIYRNFDRKVTWTKPAGIWRIATGDEAALANPDVSMQAEHMASGIYLQLISEDNSDWTSDSFHEAILANYTPADGFEPAEPRPGLEINGSPAKCATLRQDIGSGIIEFRLATTVRGDHAHQILAWGFESNMTAARDLIDEAIAGFGFPGDSLKQIARGPNWYEDQRTGFKLRVPGTGWKLTENLQPVIAPIGNSLQFSRGQEAVTLVGMHVTDSERADDMMSNMISGILKVNLERSSSGTSESKTTVAGQPAKVMKARSGKIHVRSVTLSDRGTMYVMVAESNNAAEADKLLASVQASFKLLP